MAFSSADLLASGVEVDLEPRENHFLLGVSVPRRVVAVETVEWVEAVSDDLEVLEKKLGIVKRCVYTVKYALEIVLKGNRRETGLLGMSWQGWNRL